MKTNNRKRAWMLLIVPLIVIVASITQCTKDEKKETGSENEQLNNEFVHSFVKDDPQFAGGNGAMANFIVETVEYPKEMVEQGIEGTVYVRFTVGSKGVIRNAEILKGVHKMLDKEALRVIREMPDWIPGRKEGKDVAVKFVLPISFKLS